MRLVGSLALLVAFAAPAAAQNPDPVYVQPGAGLEAAADGRLQLRIVEQAIGRIKIAVVRGGSAKAVAERIDSNIDLRGALVVVAGRQVHVITSYDPPDPAIRAVQRAFDRGGDLERKLGRSIDALARVDPGPEQDVGTPRPTTTVPGFELPDVDEVVDDVTGTIRFGFAAVLLFVFAVFALVAFVFWRNWRRTHEASEEELADARAEIEHERGLLGQDIVDLDAATAFGGDARAAYELALDAYERSELLLRQADNRRRMERVRRLVADGRAAAQRARG